MRLNSVIKLVQIINGQNKNTHYVKGILHINSIPNRSIEITRGEYQEDLNCYKKEKIMKDENCLISWKNVHHIILWNLTFNFDLNLIGLCLT